MQVNNANPLQWLPAVRHMSILFFYLLSAGFQDEVPVTEGLASLLRNGHRQSRDIIQSLSLKMEITDIPFYDFTSPEARLVARSPRVTHVEWWELPSAKRSRMSCAELTSNHLAEGGVVKSLYSHRFQREKPYLSGAISSGDLLSDENPWVEALFNVGFAPNPSVTALLDSPALKKIETVKTADKKTLYQVFFQTADGNKGELWFDPQYNYLVRKTSTYRGEDGVYRIEREVIAFREIRPGVFFPAAVEKRYSEKGKIHVTRSTRFKDVCINESIDPKIFQLKFPAGTTVVDDIKGYQYLSDEAEQPANQPSPLPVTRPVNYPTGHPDARKGFRYTLVVIPVLVATLLGVGWFGWSRYKKRQAG